MLRFLLTLLIVSLVTVVRAESDGGLCQNTTHTFEYLQTHYAPWVNFVTNEYLVTNWTFACQAAVYPDGRFVAVPVGQAQGVLESYFIFPGTASTVRHSLYLVNQTDPHKPLYFYQYLTLRAGVSNGEFGPQAHCFQQVGDNLYDPSLFHNPAFVFTRNAAIDVYISRSNPAYGSLGRMQKGEIFQWNVAKNYSQSYLHQWDDVSGQHQFTLFCDYVYAGTGPHSLVEPQPETVLAQQHQSGNPHYRQVASSAPAWTNEPLVKFGKWSLPASAITRTV